MQVYQVPDGDMFVLLHESQYVFTKVENRLDEIGQIDYCAVYLSYERRDSQWIKLTSRQVAVCKPFESCMIVNEEYVKNA